MLDNFVFKYHAQSNFARSLCLKRHSSNSILHEIFTVNGTNAVSNTAQHVWMYAWSLSYGQSEQRPKCFCPDYLSTVFSEKFMTPPILNPKQREMGSPLMTALYWSPLHLWAPSLRKISWEWEVLQARVHQLPRTEAPQGRLFLGLWCLWLWDQGCDKEKRYRQTCS